MSDITDTSRRDVIRLGGICAAALSTAPAMAFASGSIGDSRPDFPPDVGSKFYPNGLVRPFAGNTIICHLPQQGDQSGCFDAMLDIYREAPTRGFINKVALLPPSSYHMTIFGGATDRSRDAGSWPTNLPKNAPLRQCNEMLASRLRAEAFGVKLPIRMKVDPQQHPVNGHALTFRLLPADDGETAKLRQLRERLARVLEIRSNDLDTYRFHISLGYPIAWFSPSEERDFQQSWSRWASHIAAKAPIIELGAPEFCTFDDMYAFHRVLYLS